MRKMVLIAAGMLLVFGARAQKPADSAVRTDPVEIENAILDAVALLDAGDISSASARFQRIHAADSTNDAVCYYLGMCEHYSGRNESAEQYLCEAVRLDSTNTWYRNVLANLYVETNQPRKAAPLLEQLVDEYPQAYNNPYTLTLIADTRMAEYRDSTTLSWYERALELDPGYAPAEIGKGELLRMTGNMPGFFLSLGKVVGNEEVVASAKSQYLQNIMDHMDSRTWWVWGETICGLIDQCVEMHPDDMGSRWLKVNTCAIKEDWDGAIEQCREMMTRSLALGDRDNYVKACSTWGDVLHQEKNDEKGCFKMYDLALKADPEYCPVLNNYAYYLCENGKKLRKALKMSAITVEKEPDNATYLDTYGWLLHLLGRDSEAKPYFKHALIYGGRDSKVVLGHYSEVLKALGEKDLSDYYKRLSEKE